MIYWIGSRQSDIRHTGTMFAGAVVMYGEADNQHAYNNVAHVRVNNNVIGPEVAAFFVREMAAIVAADEGAHFMLYDPNWVYEMPGMDRFADRCIGILPAELYRSFNDKSSFHAMIEGITPTIETKVVRGADCTYAALCRLFGRKSATFVVQQFVSNGGEGTYLLNYHSESRLRRNIEADNDYLVSVYIRNSIPVNAHILVAKDRVVVLPASIQILHTVDHRLMYRGCDYAAYSHLGETARVAFDTACRRVAEVLQSKGYRGIAGIDGVLCGDTAYAVECNARFQGSSSVLDLALAESHLPSLQLLHKNAVEGNLSVPKTFPTVPYSAYAYHAITPRCAAKLIWNQCNKEPYVKEIDADGYNPSAHVDTDIYLYRLVFRDNIVAASPDGGVYQHENVVDLDDYIYHKVMQKDVLAVKVAMLTLGVRILDDARAYMVQAGGMRPGNNNAVDISLWDLIINAPLDIKFVAFTPFEIRLENQTLVLYYYHRRIDQVHIYPLDPLATKRTRRGVPYTTVAYLSTDRLRVHMTNECVFKATGKSCRFCNITPCKDPIDIEDIREVVKDYIYHSPGATHFLVGGQSMGQEDGRARIIQMVEAIRAHDKEKHIYVMALPYDKPTIKSLADAGMNEISCNIEVFNPKLAREYMPGKGAISREKYFRILAYARTLMPNLGDVRSMLILGLEPDKSFMRGVKRLFRLGVQPIISVFRPLPDTPLETMMAPPMQYVYQMYHRLERIGERYSLHLGPNCIHCQNNTLSLPHADAK